MSTHRVAIYTTTGTVYTLPSNEMDAMHVVGNIEDAVQNGRVFSAWTELGPQQFNILHTIRWGVELAP